ncbi:MAG: dihydroneopterin aldolase [Bacteroidia bacterium]|nr:dihydroneopterin aldolase [Bacteroidia bacterium]
MEQILKGRIGVDDLRLFARKGMHATEMNIENEFFLSAHVDYNVADLKPGAYLDYAKLVLILKECFLSESNLLEKIASEILDKIKNEWPLATGAWVRIRKSNPHFQDNLGAVVVELSW